MVEHLPWAPYGGGAEHLQDLWSGVLARLQRYVARHGHRMVQADGTLSNLYVSVQEATRQLGRHDGREHPPGPAEQHGWPDETEARVRLHQVQESIQFRLMATANHDTPVTLPLEELRGAFRLTDVELEVLVAAAAPLMSVDLARLYTFCWADFAAKVPTVAFLAELLADLSPEAVALALAPDGTLAHRGLIELRDTTRWGTPTPHPMRGVVITDSVLAYLSGYHPPLPPLLKPLCRLVRAGDCATVDSLICEPGVVERVRAAVAAMATGRGQSRLALLGDEGGGRRSLVSAVAAELGLGTLVCDLAAGSLSPTTAEALFSALDREATLRRAVLLIRLPDLTEDAAGALNILGRCLEDFPAPFVVTARRLPGAIARRVADLRAVSVPPLSLPQQRALWARTLSRHRTILTPAELESLTSRFTLTPGAIVRAAEAAGGESGRGRDARIGVASLVDTVRDHLEHQLSDMAERLQTTLTWDDAVLPPEVESALHEILDCGRNKSKVYDDWGFRRKLSYGRGLSCLFSGPPGTGKTMMAAVLGRLMGVDVYRIDLSRIASKWVGETEKNLARLFDEAERAQVILLFDEADSLFSRRTSVQSANDRFANMEINFLLQRMESYDGMTILTTNFEESIDEAFKRRIRFHVSFPMPDGELRAQLWRSMFPPQVSLGSDVSFAELGRRFPLAGGAIKNAALRAAFLSASAGTPISMAHLERAAVAEAGSLGLAIRTRGGPEGT